MAEVKGTRKSFNKMTLAEKEDYIKRGKEKFAKLEQSLHGNSVSDEIDKTNIVADFRRVQAACTDATDIAILSAIGKKLEIKRLVVAQKAQVKRGPNKKMQEAEQTENIENIAESADTKTGTTRRAPNKAKKMTSNGQETEGSVDSGEALEKEREI